MTTQPTSQPEQQAADCQKEVMAVLAKHNCKIVVAQQTLDGQIVPLKINLLVLFVPNETLEATPAAD